MDQAGIVPDRIQRRSDLGKLPFLTKDELRGQPFRLLACERKDIAIIQVSTGTTGGEEIYMAYTWNDYLLHDLAPRYSRLFPVGPGDVCLNALPYEMSTAGLAFHKSFMDGYGAAVIPAGKGGAYSTPGKTIKVMRDLRPTVVVTSPSWAVMLAEEAERSSFDLSSLRLKKMWLTGEGCSPTFRRRVEQLWGTTANFFYGSLECGALGIECDRHDGYHVPQAHVLMEIVDPGTGKALGPGETGEIVVTGLLRYDCPVLRFRTGDLGSLETAPCACGVTMPRFTMRGRVHDQIRFRGQVLSPIYLEELLLRAPEVGNWFQFVMPASDQARIKVRCEPSRGVAPDAALAEALATRMQAASGLPFTVELVHPFPRTGQKAARVVRH
ncbi:phenylacetate--CoA ligase family protein [Sorangium sp. So ce1153]|uniref:phenylacetate--CoA ligase family protein n=1 Tax=Sorangium sp. So ce1153 TaxID=3133333 RepID=UPI003F5FC40E